MISFMEYSAVYKDLAEKDFAGFLFEAESMIDNWTAGRYKTAEGYKAEKVKRCFIRLVHELGMLSQRGIGLKSISNDEYSETYESSEEIRDRLKMNAFDYLSGTGLLSYL